MTITVRNHKPMHKPMQKQKKTFIQCLIIVLILLCDNISTKCLKSEHYPKHHSYKRNYKHYPESRSNHDSIQEISKDENPMDPVNTKSSFISVSTKSLQESEIPKQCCKEHPKITLTGSARTALKTDLIRIGIQVDTKRPNAQQALQINTQTSNAVTNALINNGVTSTDITTVNFSLIPQYIYVQDQSSGSNNISIQKFDGYLVSNFIDVKTNKVNLAGKIIDLAVENRAKMINYVNFEILPETMETAKKMLIKSAVKDALQKAKEVLDPLNYEVAEISQINLSEISPVFRKFDEGRETEVKIAGAAAAPVIFNNEREVSANVLVVFLIEKKAGQSDSEKS